MILDDLPFKHVLFQDTACNHEESRVNQGGPPSKAKYYLTTDSGKYREGKVKSTPGGE